MKSLVVEDDFVSRKLLQNILAKFGESDIAVNGIEALKVVKSSLQAGEPYDLICLDIQMPELDGHQTLKEIRLLEEGFLSRNPEKEIKVIMTTGVKDKEDVLKAFKEGCEAYIQKPFSQAELLGKLEEIGLILNE